jgi:hypothetical protein
MSVATTTASGRSCLSASAIAPVPVPTSEQCETPLDDDLGLRPWDERAPVRLQRQPAEVPVAEDVGERLALSAALDELACSGALGIGERTVVLGVELDPRQAERACKQQLRVDTRGVDPATGQILGRAL